MKFAIANNFWKSSTLFGKKKTVGSFAGYEYMVNVEV